MSIVQQSNIFQTEVNIKSQHNKWGIIAMCKKLPHQDI